MGNSSSHAYELAADSVRQPVPEFVQRAEQFAQRRESHRGERHDRSIDDEIARLAGESREHLWSEVKAVLERAIQQEASRRVPAGALALHGNAYLMEKLDKHKHRAGFLLHLALVAYEARRPPQPFFDWLNGLPELERINLLRRDPLSDAAMMNEYQVHAANTLDTLRRMADDGALMLMPSEVNMFVQGVSYLDEVARSRYRLQIRGGRFVNHDGELFDTGAMQTVHSGRGWAIFVQSPESNAFYSASHVKGMFHHSSFLSGEPVRGAGEWQVEHGVLTNITGKSGHYQPQEPHFLAVLQSLQAQALDLGRAQALLFDAQKAPHAVPVTQIVNDHHLPRGLSIW